MGTSLVCQGSAMQSRAKETQDNHEELSRTRTEHQVVEDLTKQEQAENLLRGRLTQWDQFGTYRKFVLVSAAVLILISDFIFVMMAEAAFHPFSVNNRIRDPIGQDPPGLGVDPPNLFG